MALEKEVVQNFKEFWFVIALFAVIALVGTSIYHALWFVAETWGSEWNLVLAGIGFLILVHVGMYFNGKEKAKRRGRGEKPRSNLFDHL